MQITKQHMDEKMRGQKTKYMKHVSVYGASIGLADIIKLCK